LLHALGAQRAASHMAIVCFAGTGRSSNSRQEYLFWMI